MTRQPWLTLACLATYATCLAQHCDPPDLFGPAAHIPTNDFSWDAGVADLDGDGDQDVVMLDAGGFELAVYLNAGDATFAPGASIGLGEFSRNLVESDLDGDGDTDLMSVSSNSRVFLNGGDATFQPGDDVAVGDSSLDATMTDLTGDGRDDLIIAPENGAHLLVFRNNGDATFMAPDDYPIGDNTNAVVAADFDADGDTDVVVMSYYSFYVLLNQGDGTLEVQAPTTSLAQINAIDAADFDGDGAIDIVVANRVNDSVSVFLNHGDATFPFSSTIPIGADQPDLVVAADLDADGDVDIAATGQSMIDLGVLLNTGDATFLPVAVFHGDGLPSSLAAADLDGDDDRDLVTSNFVGHFDVRRNLLCEDVPTIGGFDAGRGGDMSLGAGDLIAQLRGAVAAKLGAVRLVESPALTSEFLAGVDVLLVSSVRTTGDAISPLDDAEKAALLAFVEDGGAAFILTDAQGFAQANASLLSPLGLTSTGSISDTVTPGEHPIWNGPFGQVDTVDVLSSAWFNDLGPADALGTIPGGDVPLAVIEPGAIAPGSGPVVLTADTSLFFDMFIDADAETFALNALDYLVPTGCPADVNGDGNVNILDFVAFQGLWQQQAPAGDCDHNGLYNILDFVCFQSLFTAGCP